MAPESGRGGLTGLPLSAYQSGDGIFTKEIRARNVLTVSCLHGAGFTTYTGSALQPAVAPDNATALPAGPWGYLGAGAAAAQGFHPPSQPAPAPQAPAGGANSGEAFEAASLDCSHRIAEQLKPDSGDGSLAGRLFDESLRLTANDSRVGEATRSWADCMAAAGYQATDPSALTTRFAPGGTVTEIEIATAKADAACTGQSNLAGVWFAVAAGYQKQQIDRNAEALTAQQRVVRAYDEKLTGLLAGATP